MTSLSQEDVARLLADPSPDTRIDLVAKLADQVDGADLSTAERRLAEDILRAMASDTALQVRQSVAENLKASPHLPHDVAMTLAQDVEAVALPVIQLATVFTDADLIAIVRAGSPDKQVAVAGRAEVPEAVAGVLADEGDEAAVAVLIGNEGAALTEQSLSRTLDRFGDSERIQAPLVQRKTLPITITERLVTLVSDQLRAHLVTRDDLPAAVAGDAILQARERATVGLVANDTSDADLVQLIVQLVRNNRLTGSLLLRALCMGDLTFFEVGLSLLSRVPLVEARRLIHDGGEEGLKSLWTKAGLAPALYPAARVAIDVAHETEFDGLDGDRRRHRRRTIERILTQYEAFATEDLDYLLSKLDDLIRPAA